MYRIIQYTLLFLIVTALQVLFFNNLQLNLYVHPFVYLAFVILLPMEIKGYWLLLLAAITGVAMDFFTGMPGVNTAATAAAAFCRPGILRLFVGKDVLSDRGVPNRWKIGSGKFLRYALTMILIHSVVFFALETLSAIGIGFTLLRIAASTLCSLIVIWFVQLLFISRKTTAH